MHEWERVKPVDPPVEERYIHYVSTIETFELPILPLSDPGENYYLPDIRQITLPYRQTKSAQTDTMVCPITLLGYTRMEETVDRLPVVNPPPEGLGKRMTMVLMVMLLTGMIALSVLFVFIFFVCWEQ